MELEFFVKSTLVLVQPCGENEEGLKDFVSLASWYSRRFVPDQERLKIKLQGSGDTYSLKLCE